VHTAREVYSKLYKVSITELSWLNFTLWANFLVLSDELETSMRLLGVTNLDQLRPHMVNTKSLDMILMDELPELNLSKARL
jgi:hypothetical protein